jgi:hypothetical protein
VRHTEQIPAWRSAGQLSGASAARCFGEAGLRLGTGNGLRLVVTSGTGVVAGQVAVTGYVAE